MTEIKEKRRGRPKGENKVHSIRCNDEEYLLLKEYLKRHREKQVTETEKIKKLEAAGQKKLKF